MSGYVSGLGHVNHPAASPVAVLKLDRDYLLDRIALAKPDASETTREAIVGAVLNYQGNDPAAVLAFATNLERKIADRRGN